jgi:hypothetical protein
VNTSKIRGSNDMHYLAVDIDHPAQLIPSSTPGHSHLYIAKPLTWPEMVDVLGALARVGIVEPGYAAAAIRQGHTTLRLPWVRKSRRPRSRRRYREPDPPSDFLPLLLLTPNGDPF